MTHCRTAGSVHISGRNDNGERLHLFDGNSQDGPKPGWSNITGVVSSVHKRLAKKGPASELKGRPEPRLTAILVADDVLGAAERREVMQARLNDCTKWAEDDQAEWAPEKCIIMCIEEQDALE